MKGNTMSNVMTDIIPARGRRYFYAAFAFVGVVLGSWQIADPTSTVPETALAVYAFAGTAFGVTAGANTPRAGEANKGEHRAG